MSVRKFGAEIAQALDDLNEANAKAAAAAKRLEELQQEYDREARVSKFFADQDASNRARAELGLD